MLVRKIS